MYNLEKALEPKCYEFHWEVQGYDCLVDKVTSPVFRVNFEVTEWKMELDLSKLKSTKCCIPFNLKREGDIGPSTVTFVVGVEIEIRGHTRSTEKAVTFNKENDSYDILFEVPSDPASDWLSSKSLFIHLKLESSHADPQFPKRYWYNSKSLKIVEENLKDLYSNPHFHDTSFRVAEKEFKLHRSILNARWPKLASTLKINETSSLVDAKDLSGASPAILEKLFQFAYCGNLEFMYQLDEIEGGMDVFNLVKKHNFYRLNNSITQLSPVCESTQMFQSYRTTVNMTFSHVNILNVKTRQVPMGDFRTCDIPLKPRHLPTSDTPMTPEDLEKYQRHIKFMDVRLYVDKGPLEFNWLKYSIVLGKIPKKNPVTIMCRLYVTGNAKEDVLLSDQTHVFKEGHSGFKEHSIKTPFSEGKVSTRYEVTSEPIITWDDLTDRSKEFMQKSELSSGWYKDRGLSRMEPSSEKDRPSGEGSSSEKDRPSGEGSSSEKDRPSGEGSSCEKECPSEKEDPYDLYFTFELKLADGEEVHDERHGECIFEYKWDHKIFEDLKFMSGDKKFTDVTVTDKDGSIEVDAHKAILAARSKILEAELQRKRNLVPLKMDIEKDCLKMFVQYLYTGLIPEVPSDKIDHLRDVAGKYELECLLEVLDNQKNENNGTAANGSESSN